MEPHAIKMVETVVRGVRNQRLSTACITRAWRWAWVQQAINKFLAKVINDEKYFNYCPYLCTPRGVAILSLFDLKTKRWSYRWGGLSPLALVMMAVVGPTLLATKSESGEDVSV